MCLFLFNVGALAVENQNVTLLRDRVFFSGVIVMFHHYNHKIYFDYCINLFVIVIYRLGLTLILVNFINLIYNFMVILYLNQVIITGELLERCCKLIIIPIITIVSLILLLFRMTLKKEKSGKWKRLLHDRVRIISLEYQYMFIYRLEKSLMLIFGWK